MNIRLKESINNSIAIRESEIINTKHLIDNMISMETSFSIEILESYLIDIGYISISKNYMMKLNKLIDYCSENKVDSISKLQRKLFVEYGIPFITLDNCQLLSVIEEYKNENSIYTLEKEYVKQIVIRENEEDIMINNLEDLIEFGIRNTYINYDLLTKFCEEYPKYNYSEIRRELHNREIRTTEDEIIFDLIHLDAIKRDFTNFFDKIDDNIIYEDEINITKILKVDKNIKDIITNEGMRTSNDYLYNLTSIGLKKIRIILINLSLSKKMIYTVSELNAIFNNNDIQILKKLKWIAEKDSKIYINTLLEPLMESIGKSHGEYKKSFKCKVSSLKNHEFYNIYGMYIKEILINSNEISTFVEFLKEANKENMFSIEEIMYYCIKNDIQGCFIDTFIGTKPSNSISDLINYSDVCFKCKGLESCIGIKLEYKSKKEISRILLTNRNKVSNEYLLKLEKHKKIEILENQTLILKFITSYTMVVKTKSILKQLGILDDNELVLRKNDGKYCPKNDIWRLKI